MKKEMPLTKALSRGEEDLMKILVSSGISCWTCYKNKEHKGWGEGGFYCEIENTFAAAPELSVCLKWREDRTEEQIKAFDADGKWKTINND